MHSLPLLTDPLHPLTLLLPGYVHSGYVPLVEELVPKPKPQRTRNGEQEGKLPALK